MLWEQRLKVFPNHKNLIQDALGLTSDHIFWWRLLLEELGPKIMHIKGINNMVDGAISRLDLGPFQDEKADWMTFIKCWCHNEGKGKRLKVLKFVFKYNYSNSTKNL